MRRGFFVEQRRLLPPPSLGLQNRTTCDLHHIVRSMLTANKRWASANTTPAEALCGQSYPGGTSFWHSPTTTA
jgi:hypothetical protein